MTSKEYSERYIYMFMDAMPANLEFKLDDLKIIEMQERHCAFELSMTQAAMDMLQLKTPIEDKEKTLDAIEDTIRRIRLGEELECKETFPAATLGVLWGWQLVSDLNWKWCAVSQSWWETLAVCDQSQRYAVLPVQYFRRMVGETGMIGEKGDNTVTRGPRDLLTDIRDGRLPKQVDGKLYCMF
jgi:hypothetical protein